MNSKAARIHCREQNARHCARRAKQPAKYEVAVGNDWPGYSKLLLLLLLQENIGNWYCGILISAPSVWLEPLLTGFSLVGRLVLEQVTKGCLSILWCHQRCSSKLANRNWDRKHVDHRVHDLCLAPQIHEPLKG